MRLAFLLRYWPYYGGGETVTRALTTELLKRGHEVHIIYWWKNGQGRIYHPEGLYFEHIFQVQKIGDYNPDGDIGWLKYELKEFVKTYNIDFVINQWWPAGLVPEGTDTKYIKCWHTYLIHNILYSGNVLKYLYRRLKQDKSRIIADYIDPYYVESDALVFLSKIYTDEYRKYSASFSSKKDVCYIYNPLIYENIPTINNSMKKKEVVFVGRIEESVKKITRILYAWRIINKNIYDWKLKIIGDGPDLNTLKSLAKDLKLGNIAFLGAKDPRDDYETASILLITSDIEGWPMTVVEGKSYGVVPLVMNTFSAANEIVDNGNTGVVCNSAKISVFADMLMSLMMDEERRNILSNNAIKDSRKFHVSNIVDSWIELMNRLSYK